jgi:ABC-type uncharacterized transport system ATPase subunit
VNAATAAPVGASDAPVIELRGVSKRYANGTLANHDVNLSVQGGGIHAIVGENGAGKSTVMKMLYGLEQPSSGQILLRGRPVVFRHPAHAIAAGIGLVPQHMQLLPSFTVAQNVVLGREPRRGWLRLDHAGAVRDVARLSERYGLRIDPRARVDDLSVGERQRVEILKTLYRGAQVLLLDEPSAVLSPQEAQSLFAALRQLVAQGLTVIVISHKLAEVREVSDRFTVLRGGQVAGHAESRTASDDDIARMIIGRPLQPMQAARLAPVGSQARVTVRGLCAGAGLGRGEGAGRGQGAGRPLLNDVSFDIAAGEVLGVAGVEGNGQDVLVALLSGLRAPSRGEARLDGATFTGLGAREARGRGVAAIPEDRLRDGLAPGMSLTENFIATSYHRSPLSRLGGRLDMALARRQAQDAVERFGVKAESADMPMALLSGGNMQKLVLAREISGDPRFLIASQPTRGVDIGSAQSLRRHLLDLRDRGAALLLVSADLDEVLALSDRIIVLYQGEVVAHFVAGQASATVLGACMTGLQRQPGAHGLLGQETRA